MVSGWFHHSQEELNDFDDATQEILGPRNERTPDSTAYEDTGCANQTRDKRCYSAALAIQQSRHVVAPTASLSQDVENIEEYQDMTTNILSSTSAMLLNVQDLLPDDCRKAFKANAELTGQPSIGSAGILGTGSVQLNISAAGLSATDNRLANQLGDFGCEHFDKTDSPDHFTTMLSNPDIPTTYQPGAFHILQLGVFSVLYKFVGVTFSGRRRHVGTAPTPPPGSPPVPYAYRFNVVWYPKDAAVNGNSRWTLASLPGPSSTSVKPRKRCQKGAKVAPKGAPESEKGKQRADGDTQRKKVKAPDPLYLTPEMINLRNESTVARTTNRATFARSGNIIMDRESHMNFMGRSLHMVASYIWRQLPEYYGVEIDLDKVMESVTFKKESDPSQRVSLAPWKSGPNVSTVSDDRKKNQIVWASYQQRVRRYIPHIAGNPTRSSTSNTRAESDTDGETEDETDVEPAEPIRSSEKAKGKGGADSKRSSNVNQGAMPQQPRASGSGSGSASRTGNASERGGALRSGGASGRSGSGSASGSGSRRGSGSGSGGAAFCDGQPPLSGRPVDHPMGGVTTPIQSVPSLRKRPLETSGGTGDGAAKRSCAAASVPPRAQLGPDAFPFLSGLTQDVMSSELRDIEKESNLAMTYRQNLASAFHLPQLLATSDSLVKQPLSMLAPGHIREVISEIRAGSQADIGRLIDTRFERYAILMSSVRVWYWLDITIRDAIRDIFHSTEDKSDWLGMMVKVTKMYLETKTDTIKFDPAAYPAFLVLGTSTVVVPNRFRRYFQTTPEDQAVLLEAVIQTIQSMLMDALDFPRDSEMLDRRRAWLMGTLVHAIGPAFLATGVYRLNPDLIKPFHDALRLHPICQEDSSIRLTYTRFGQCFQAMVTQSPAPTTAMGTILPSNTMAESRLLGLDTFLKACIQYTIGTLPTQHPVYRLLSQNPDFYSPFRERAPSKVRFGGPNGPLSPSVIKTTSGLFSAVTFRGILYNTPFSLHPEAPMVFSNLDDWHTQMAAFRNSHPESAANPYYFCNPNAYSRQPIAGRSLENAELFWDKAVGLDWDKRTQNVLPFAECLHIITEANFPTMGNLQLFLLAGDLHYAGVCHPPEFADVADFLFCQKPKGGSLKALAFLGLITDIRHASRQEIELALRFLDSHLKRVLSESERVLMLYDLICLEHLSCKYKRAIKAGAAV
ncbi:hypothetical protein NMY22_g14501 [Coprinellus aureogranulatus]|nr:hypothetical protein NMY22_g14501 [Coprinellus aureogranulatus]